MVSKELIVKSNKNTQVDVHPVFQRQFPSVSKNEWLLAPSFKKGLAAGHSLCSPIFPWKFFKKINRQQTDRTSFAKLTSHFTEFRSQVASSASSRDLAPDHGRDVCGYWGLVWTNSDGLYKNDLIWW
jgi:hypothetical protein